MTSRVIHLRMKDWVLVACLDFIQDKTSVADAARRTLEAFIIAMQQKGSIPMRDKIEVKRILEEHGILEPPPVRRLDIDDVRGALQQVDSTKDEEQEIADVASEVEARIQGASTPDVKQSISLEEQETYTPQKPIKINLFLQERDTFKSLQRRAPKDRFIEKAQSYLMKESTILTKEELIFIAALELVYTNLPQDIWGSEVAKGHIEDVIKMHGEET